MELATEAHDVLISWVPLVVQPGEPQQSPHEIPASAYYVSEIPKLPCHAENVPRLCAASSRANDRAELW